MTAIDPTRETVRLCVAGVQAEQAGDHAAAAAHYGEAWGAATDDLDRAVAAHYLARVQDDAERRQHWNGTALDHALAAGKDAESLLPSLHLNLGHSHEERGDLAAARGHYADAARALDAISDPHLVEALGHPIERAQRRTGGTG